MKVQSELLLTERLELQALKDTLAQAQEAEEKAISLLNEGEHQAIPPAFLARRAVSSAIKIRSCANLLQTQIEKTLDQARKETLIKKKLDFEHANVSRAESKRALQLMIDAHLSSSLKQD